MKAKCIKKGLNIPIEITVDDVVIDGHQRLREAKELGWEKIEVWVRDDLEDERAINQRHIEANLERRQLTKLEQARLIKAMYDLERRERPRRRADQPGDIRDRIAKRFGIDGRTAERWMNLLDTPPAIQEAVSQDKLTMTLAEKVSHLTNDLKQLVADRIEGGEPVVQVVKTVLAQKAEPKKQREMQPERRQTCVEVLDEIAELLDKVEVDTDLRSRTPTEASKC